jgi:hypothetical protein
LLRDGPQWDLLHRPFGGAGARTVHVELTAPTEARQGDIITVGVCSPRKVSIAGSHSQFHFDINNQG